MLIVSKNLRGLMSSFEIARDSLFDEFSIKIRLDHSVRRMREVPISENPVTYGSPYKEEDYFHDLERTTGNLTLRPGENLLACSRDEYRMPPGYFGLVQTKGSLARLFVMVTCNDGQVEPGYCGKITLEISNLAKHAVVLPPEADVAQLFIFRCSTEDNQLYSGRYQSATLPTLARFD